EIDLLTNGFSKGEYQIENNITAFDARAQKMIEYIAAGIPQNVEHYYTEHYTHRIRDIEVPLQYEEHPEPNQRPQNN
ncbi:hypothetical protein ACKI1O_46490, partial [Streptomyces scabiei]